MSLTHIPAPAESTFPVPAAAAANRASRRLAFVAVGILSVAAGAALVVDANPGDATPASCAVADHTWPSARADAPAWPTGRTPVGEHLISQPGTDAQWATSGEAVIWPSGQSTPSICG